MKIKYTDIKGFNYDVEEDILTVETDFHTYREVEVNNEEAGRGCINYAEYLNEVYLGHKVDGQINIDPNEVETISFTVDFSESAKGNVTSKTSERYYKVFDGYVKEGDVVWWLSNNGAISSLARGHDLKNIKEYPKCYSIHEPSEYITVAPNKNIWKFTEGKVGTWLYEKGEMTKL